MEISWPLFNPFILGVQVYRPGPVQGNHIQSIACVEYMVDKNFGWTVEMQIKALKKGLRIVEVPVRYRRRIGKSKITGTFSGTVRAGTKIVYTIFKYGLIK